MRVFQNPDQERSGAEQSRDSKRDSKKLRIGPWATEVALSSQKCAKAEMRERERERKRERALSVKRYLLIGSVVCVHCILSSVSHHLLRCTCI